MQKYGSFSLFFVFFMFYICKKSDDSLFSFKTKINFVLNLKSFESKKCEEYFIFSSPRNPILKVENLKENKTNYINL